MIVRMFAIIMTNLQDLTIRSDVQNIGVLLLLHMGNSKQIIV